MGILYQTDEQGKRLAVVVPISEWEAIQAQFCSDAWLSPQDEQDCREAQEDYLRGEVLGLGNGTTDK